MSVIAEGTGYNYGSSRGGARRWLAPELVDPARFSLENSRPAYASDIYAFAITVVEVRDLSIVRPKHDINITDMKLWDAGKVPFDNLNEHQVIIAVLSGQRPPRPVLKDAEKEIPMSDSLWVVTTTCWRQQPAERPAATHAVRALKKSARQLLR